jgi:molybdopterin converting factor small subunit
MDSAPTITIYVPGPLRVYCDGASKLSLSAPTVRAALDQLELHHEPLHRNIRDEAGAVRRHLGIFVNSDHVRDLQGLDTALAPGDVVTILPAVSGG